VILARAAVERPRPERRIADRGENVPGRGDQQNDYEAAQRTKALPRTTEKELFRQQQVSESSADRNRDRDHALYQQAES
jgi:hypothetical protein